MEHHASTKTNRMKKKLEDRIIEFKCKTSGLAFTCIYIHHVRISTSEIVSRENHM